MTSAMEMGTSFTEEFVATQRKLRAFELIKRARLIMIDPTSAPSDLETVAGDMVAMSEWIDDANRIGVSISRGMLVRATIDGVDAPDAALAVSRVLSSIAYREYMIDLRRDRQRTKELARIVDDGPEDYCDVYSCNA